MEFEIKETDRILVVAPHPDDESIGCGGVLALYGKQSDVLLITDGDNGAASDLADIRESEFIEVMSYAGVREYKCLRIPEHQIKLNYGKIAQIDFGKYTHVFVPNKYEAHDDHVAVYKIIKKIIKGKVNLYEYEVWTPLCKPNIYLDITEVCEKKISMIECHKSQTKNLDYVNMIMGLNAYRGIGHGYAYAECYYCVKEKNAQTLRRIKRKIKSIIKKL